MQRRRVPSYAIPVADLRDCTLAELRGRLDIGKFTEASSETVGQTPNSAFSFDVSRAALVSRLSSSFQRFDEFCVDIANGISTSCDDVYIVSDALATELQLEQEQLEPTIRGGQFSRYLCPRSTRELVLYITSEFNPRQNPHIDSYLAEHKERLIQSSVEKRNGARNWRILFRARYPGLFVCPKILIRQTADRIVAACDSETGYYCIDSVNVGVLRPEFVSSGHYFLGLLNSSLLNFFYRELSQERGRVLAQVKPQRIKCLPICFGNKEYERRIITLVDQIVDMKHDSPNADTSQLEDEIDAIIYTLYELTSDEI
jgi:hypothetical protein